MTEPPGYDLSRAIEYIETLQTPPPALGIEDVDERIASIARQNARTAGLEETVEILVADAKEAVRGLDGRFGLILRTARRTITSRCSTVWWSCSSPAALS
jgi:predicted O-methyltransferase YrrM